MVLNKHTILVELLNKASGQDVFEKQVHLTKTLKKENGDLTRTYEEQTEAQLRRMTIQSKTNKAGEKETTINTELLAQGPKFQMHFLGIMFGGMALNRAMSNLTATSKEWVGIGELMSTTMGVVMLPATLELLDQAVLPLMEALLGMPEFVQTIVGVTVLGLEGLGKIAEVGGQIALGAAAFRYQFPAMATFIKKNLTSALAKSVGKGIGISIALIVAWESIDFIREGISEGDLMKELLGIMGLGLGLGAAALFVGLGVVGGVVAFSLGISIGLVISWFIRENKKEDIANAISSATKDMQGDFFENTTVGKSIKSITAGPATLTGLLAPKGGSTILDFLKNPFGASSKAVGGNITSDGLHFLHEGETVLRNDEVNNQGGNVSVIYNVTVSDKREFEQMLKNNNQQLVREVRRNATI